MSDIEFLKEHARDHQKFLLDTKITQRGLLLFHTVGTGKTFTSLFLAYRDYLREGRNKVYVVTNRNIFDNFRNDLDKFNTIVLNGKIPFGSEELQLKFIPMNSEKLKDGIENELKKSPDKSKITIIIDEVHNLFNSITNDSKRAIKLYDFITNNQDVRLYCLSGTSITNDLYETVPCFNMLMKFKIARGGKYIKKPLEENYDAFKDINMIELENIVKSGIVSYYPENPDDNALRDSQFPTDLGTEYVKIKMTDEQIAEHQIEASKEENNAMNRKKDILHRYGDRAYMAANASRSAISKDYNKSRIDSVVQGKTGSRTVCNASYYPTLLTGQTDIDKNEMRMLLRSSKFAAIVKNFSGVGKNLVYSQFVNRYGLGGFEMYLASMGWSRYGHEEAYDNTIKLTTKGITNKKKYIVISGEIPQETRDEYIKVFNSTDNAMGDKIPLILISASGAEGIDLKCIRTIHIMEPYWNFSRIVQVKGRGIRFKSHVDVKPEFRNVKTFIYVSTFGVDGTETTDEFILNRAIHKQKLIDRFMPIIEKYCVEKWTPPAD